MQSFSLSLSHTVEIKMILKSNKREDKETRIQAKEPYHLFVSAAECGDAPKKKGFFKGFWKRSRHYSLENQQPRLGSRVMGHQQRQTSRQQHHYRQHVATSALTHSACCCIVQQPRSRFVVEPATRFAFFRPFHRAFIPPDQWSPNTTTSYVNPWVKSFCVSFLFLDSFPPLLHLSPITSSLYFVLFFFSFTLISHYISLHIRDTSIMCILYIVQLLSHNNSFQHFTLKHETEQRGDNVKCCANRVDLSPSGVRIKYHFSILFD